MNENTVTPESIDSKIVEDVYYRFPGTTVTVCCLTLGNGFNVIGESACADPVNFNEDIGKKIAKESAKSKMWALEGYLLKERLSQ